MEKPAYNALIVVAVFLLLCGVAFISVALGTNHWIEYSVAASAIGSTPEAGYAAHPELYYTRSRGLFQTCFALQTDFNTVTTMAGFAGGNGANYITNSMCLKEYVFVSGDTSGMRDGILLGQIGLMITSAVVLAVSAALAGLGAWYTKMNFVKYAGYAGTFGGFAGMIGMTLMQVYQYLESSVASQNRVIFPFYAFTVGQTTGYGNLNAASGNMGNYGFSYGMAWAGASVATVAPILLNLALKNMRKALGDNLPDQDLMYKDDDYYGRGESNPAYGFYDGAQPKPRVVYEDIYAPAPAPRRAPPAVRYVMPAGRPWAATRMAMQRPYSSAVQYRGGYY